MECCITNLYQCMNKKSEYNSDPCDAYLSGGRVCGQVNCTKPLRTINVFGVQRQTKKLNFHRPTLTTVRDLKMCIKSRFQIDPEHQRIIFGDIELDKSVGLLKDFGVEDNSTIILVARLSGGKNRQSTKSYFGFEPGIQVSKGLDCMHHDKIPEQMTTKMSCGHNVDPQSLLDFVNAEINSGEFSFRCPAKTKTSSDEGSQCGALWSYVEIRKFVVSMNLKMALFSSSEKLRIEQKLALNMAKRKLGAKECPKCFSLVQRTTQRTNRTVCRICSMRSDEKLFRANISCFLSKPPSETSAFCWTCLQPWKSSHELNHCGNSECSYLAASLLADSPVVSICSKDVPSIRTCPNCFFLACHISGGSRVRCRNCHQLFCFICLKQKCNGLDCPVAPRQLII